RALDASERDHAFTSRDELVGEEADVERAVEAREESVDDLVEAFEVPAADRHPARQIVHDVRRLEAAQPLAMPRDRRLVERADALLVVVLFFGHRAPRSRGSFPAVAGSTLAHDRDRRGARTRRAGIGSYGFRVILKLRHAPAVHPAALQAV